jgi:hypothetical protein
MNVNPIVAAVVLLGATLASLAGFDLLPGEQSDLVAHGTTAVAGLAGLYATFRAIQARRNQPPAPPAE